MAINDFLKLNDDKLHEVFNRKAYDPTKDRQAMIKRLDTANNQFASATPTKGKKMWSISNGVVKLTLPFAIAGKSEFHIPSERFADAITHLKDAIIKGEADEHLKAQNEGGSTSTAKTRKSSGGGAGWSDERRAKFAQTVAARKAAKANG